MADKKRAARVYICLTFQAMDEFRHTVVPCPTEPMLWRRLIAALSVPHGLPRWSFCRVMTQQVDMASCDPRFLRLLVPVSQTKQVAQNRQKMPLFPMDSMNPLPCSHESNVSSACIQRWASYSCAQVPVKHALGGVSACPPDIKASWCVFCSAFPVRTYSLDTLCRMRTLNHQHWTRRLAISAEASVSRNMLGWCLRSLERRGADCKQVNCTNTKDPHTTAPWG